MMIVPMRDPVDMLDTVLRDVYKYMKEKDAFSENKSVELTEENFYELGLTTIKLSNGLNEIWPLRQTESGKYWIDKTMITDFRKKANAVILKTILFWSLIIAGPIITLAILFSL